MSHALAVAAVLALYAAAFAALAYLAPRPHLARRIVAAARVLPRFVRGYRYHRAGEARHAAPPTPKTTPALTTARTAS